MVLRTPWTGDWSPRSTRSLDFLLILLLPSFSLWAFSHLQYPAGPYHASLAVILALSSYHLHLVACAAENGGLPRGASGAKHRSRRELREALADNPFIPPPLACECRGHRHYPSCLAHLLGPVGI
ncbi:hypothetical protein BJ875DRAFT_459465 [Amylocarpus encephaloides]|uniref:Uncharacterized protein n=1 Tax=Amylocarpus encephaloides TaxID=45428 RepID=A0A9P7YK12_9HELO|nr:hypothetical protein BJ875DRAFT_459465 [Amylocarpus encephaloides]